MTYWTWNTAQGEFRIEQIGPNHIDLLFEKSVIGSYPTPQEAADQCGEGRHAQISESFNGGSLGVSRFLADWSQTHAVDGEPPEYPAGVLGELQQFLFQSQRPRGTLHLPRNR